MSVKLEETVTVTFVTKDSTGALADADSLPVGELYLDGVNSLATVTITNVKTGVYKAAFTVGSANGFAADDTATLIIRATIGGIATGGKEWEDIVKAYDIDDVYALVNGLNNLSTADILALAVLADNTTLQNVLKDLWAGIVGSGAKSGSAYAYKDSAGDTRFTHTISSSARTKS